MDSTQAILVLLEMKIASGICSGDLVSMSFLAAVATKSCINFSVVFLCIIFSCKETSAER